MIADPPIGGLRDRVSYQKRMSTPEAGGGQMVDFVPGATLWARVTPLGTRWGAAADGRGVMATHSVVLRFRTDIRAGDRFVFRGRRLVVESAEGIAGGRTFLGCRCRETAVTG